MPDFTLYRADDNLALTVRVTDMVLELFGSIYVLRAPNGIGAISLIYQPQHAIEFGAKQTAPSRRRSCRCTPHLPR